MKRLSIRTIAKQTNGRSRACARCKYLGLCTPDVSTICYNSFIEGFIKGVKYQKGKK